MYLLESSKLVRFLEEKYILNYKVESGCKFLKYILSYKKNKKQVQFLKTQNFFSFL